MQTMGSASESPGVQTLVEVNTLGFERNVTSTLDNSCFRNLTLSGTFCSLFSSENKSIPSAVQKNTFPQVMMPLPRLAPIDFRLASALQGVWKLVQEGGSGFRSQGMSGWDLLLKLTATTLQEGRDFPLLTKIS